MKNEPAISNGPPRSQHLLNNDRLDLSVVIITLNEERVLAHTLGALPLGCEIIVLDSGSDDKTVAIAESYGARVSQRAFDDYASQKNAAIALASRQWILSIDADEVLDGRLAAAVYQRVRSKAPAAAYRIRRQLFFQGRALRHGRSVDWPIRLFPRGACRFEGHIHESVRTNGVPTLALRDGGLLHYSYPDLTQYFRQFNHLTSKVAENHLRNGDRSPTLPILVFRPFFEFFVRYFVKGGVLDGFPGFTYALVSSLYAFVKYAKLRELEKARQMSAATL